MPLFPRDPTPSWQDWARFPDESERPDMWRGLTLAWVPLLGPSGNFVADVSRGLNHGALTNMEQVDDWVVNEKGWAIKFRGTSGEFANVSNVGTLGYNATNEATMIASVSVASGFSGTGGIADQSDATSTNRGFQMFYQSNTIKFRARAGGNQTASSGTLSFPHSGVFVGTYSGSDAAVRIYVDGVEVGADTDSVGATWNNTLTGDFTMGRLHGNVFPLGGEINYVICLNRRLTASEIASDWLDPMAMFRPLPLAVSAFVPAAGITDGEIAAATGPKRHDVDLPPAEVVAY